MRAPLLLLRRVVMISALAGAIVISAACLFSPPLSPGR
jgi:hypothetical protein